MRGHLIHLVCGSTGAGKTTYSRQLADALSGVVFSVDQWMATLFWIDSPKPLQATWSMERVERCAAQIWATASEVAPLGVPCVLDLGFTQRGTRARFVQLARQSGLSAQLHVLDVPTDERWRRVLARNTAGGTAAQLPFDVTRDMFDFVETLWEPPTDEELAACDGIRAAGPAPG